MIPLITAVPAEPEDAPVGALSDAFEDAAPSNQYWTKKDLKWLLVALLILLLVGIPAFLRLRDFKYRYVCGQNFQNISTAMSTYVADNDDRFPPTYVPDVNSLSPRLDDKGRPYTWASTLVGLSGFDTTKHSFACPAADSSEVMIAGGFKGADLPMTYGMYGAYNTAPHTTSSSAAQSVLVTETANNGALGTFDPHPMPATNGLVHDGFLIGWETGDFVMPPVGKAPKVTRVAVPDSKTGLTTALFRNGRNPSGRHDDEVFVLFVDGHYRPVKVGRLLNPSFWEIPSH